VLVARVLGLRESNGHLAAPLHSMAGLSRMPTRRGDVLILVTTRTFTMYGVVTVTTDGQQDFGTGINGVHLPDLAAAVKLAKSLAAPERHVYLVNIDTGDWRMMSGAPAESASWKVDV
jgi:hypothetical protein